MDAESQRVSPLQSSDHSPGNECMVCRRAFTPGSQVNDGFEAISICRECKSLVLEDNERSATIRNIRQRRQRRSGRSRYGSSELIEGLFSQQFSQLIGLVRQNHDMQADDGDTTTVRSVHQHASYSTSRSWPRNLRRAALSDNDSESVDHMDSLFGESDSNISFYGGDSDASVDGNSLLEREMFTQLDTESHFYTDTDIDPMHAGLDQWDWDAQDEDEVDWEEVNVEDAPVRFVEHTINSPNGSVGSSGTWFGLGVRHAELFAELEESDAPFVWNSGNNVNARGTEEFLEQLAEADGWRRGAPPAARSVIRSLPFVTISKGHEKNGSLVCAVCKDSLPIGTEAKQLPCLHLYHASCILPWLKSRNSCPVCRFELPTDNLEYEEGKRNASRIERIREIQRLDHQAEETFSEVSSDVEANDAHDESSEARPEQADSLNRDGGSSGGRWFFLAAAPIVSFVGIAIALWFGNSVRTGNPEQTQPQRSRSTLILADRNRRWWSFF